MTGQKNSGKNTGINEALKRFGGFVRYFDTTEPLKQLADLVSSNDHRHILACCGGGDQALTMLGAVKGKADLWAIDINPSQLFVLAGKAALLKKNDPWPSFDQIQKAYPGRIAAVKKNIRSLRQMYIYHSATGKKFLAPAEWGEKYKVVTGNEMFFLRDSGPYWKKDAPFMARVRARLGSLQFLRMDIFDSPDIFKPGSLDLIYLSDIFWPQALAYHQAQLARLAKVLSPGGRIISFLDEGDDYMGQGISPGRMLALQARNLNLKIIADQEHGYLVLEKNRRGK